MLQSYSALLQQDMLKLFAKCHSDIPRGIREDIKKMDPGDAKDPKLLEITITQAVIREAGAVRARGDETSALSAMRAEMDAKLAALAAENAKLSAKSAELSAKLSGIDRDRRNGNRNDNNCNNQGGVQQ